MDRIKGTEALYTSLDKVIEVLVAKKEIALAQNILDRLMITPTTNSEGNYHRLWGQEKMNTLLGHVKEASV